MDRQNPATDRIDKYLQSNYGHTLQDQKSHQYQQINQDQQTSNTFIGSNSFQKQEQFER